LFLTSPSCSVLRLNTWWPQLWDAGSASATDSPLYEGGSDHVCCIGGIRFLLRAGVQQGVHEHVSLPPAH
jgi:hypothetical protein